MLNAIRWERKGPCFECSGTGKVVVSPDGIRKETVKCPCCNGCGENVELVGKTRIRETTIPKELANNAPIGWSACWFARGKYVYFAFR